MSINLTDELLAKTKKGKIASAKQVFLEGDKENLQQIGEKTHQLEDAIKDITVSGGASTANAVSYNNETSGMTAITAQGAIDELAARSQAQDAAIGTKAEKSEVTTELDKKFNKEDIAQDFGDSKDKVVSQFALPYRYIQNEEFIFAKVDANEKLLFGIEWDGTPKFGKTSAVEDRLQAQVNLLADKIRNILGDDDTTSAIDTLKELKNFFANIDNTQTLTSILANLSTTIDKVTIKDEAGEIQDSPFRVISNEEFLWAVVDSDDKVLFGFYRATGKPFCPLNEMYHVIQNEEYFAAWVSVDDKVVLGIRKDGEIIGEIHAVNALKEVISSLQEKVDTIDASLQELLDVFSLQENPEYMAIEKDADGKVLSATYNDGSHYSHNLKSETIDAKVDKKEGKSLIDSDVAEANSTLEDPEGRTEITTDADGKVFGYRDSEGTRHEHKISANHIELSDEAANEVNEAFKSAGIKTDNPSDFSNDSYVELPIPRIAAQVKLYAPKLPTTKTGDVEAEIEYIDKDGNYFKIKVILNAQGSSSMRYKVKNMAFDTLDGRKIKFGDFPAQDSFHIKKYYIDAFRGQCIVGYWLTEQVYKSRPLGEQYPYEYLQNTITKDEGNGIVSKDFFNGAKCHPDGFPVVITWINSVTGEENYMGVYTWNLKKSKEVYNMDKSNPNNIVLDGIIGTDTLFGGSISWKDFEIRNPKSLKDIDGNKYDGDNPKELSDTDTKSKAVKDNLERFSAACAAIASDKTKENFEKYFLVNPFIDYVLLSQFLYNVDGFRKNWIWCSWDGKRFTPTMYDLDSLFGQDTTGTSIIPNSTTLSLGDKVKPCDLLIELYNDVLLARYKYLRDNGIFSVENVVSLMEKWLDKVGYNNIKKDLDTYKDTPSYRNSYINEQWEFVNYTWNDSMSDYSEEKTYNEGETCVYKGYKFKAKSQVQGVVPVSKVYDSQPYLMGFHNSLLRVKLWMDERIKTLDNKYNYNFK
nr:MAG TPA: CotH kinase protein [Crassvirales sp.]